MRPSEQLRGISDGLSAGHPFVHLAVLGPMGALGIPAPAGEPEVLRDAAASFRGGGASLLDQASLDLDQLRRDRLPQVWDSRWGSEAAAQRLEHTARHTEGAAAVFGNIGSCLGWLGTRLSIAQTRDGSAREQLTEVYHRWEQAPDEDRDTLVTTMAYLVGQMADAAELAEESGIEAAQLLNGYAAQAVAGQLQIPWMNAADLISVVNTTDGVGLILTFSDAARASEALAGLSATDRAAFATLLSQAEGDHEQAWLLKALAAGNSLEELAGFADTIRGRGEGWLEQHLRPLRPPGTVAPGSPEVVTWNDAHLGQTTGTTCGSMGVMMIHARYDPVYALHLVWDPSLHNGQGGVVSPAVMQQRLAEEEARIKQETDGWRLDWPPWWPSSAGTYPDRVADYLSQHTPVDYQGSLAPATGGSAVVRDNVAEAVAAASNGEPTMLLVGKPLTLNLGENTIHYVVVLGQDDAGNVLIYDSRNQRNPGVIRAVPPDDLYEEPLAEWGTLDRLHGTVSPAT